jgi:carbonic anhydrase
VKRDPFADPGQYESLASGAYEAPKKKLVEPTSASLASYPSLEDQAPATAPALTPANTAELKLASVIAEPSSEITPDLALASLVHGNERFASGNMQPEHRGVARRRALASEQHPHSVILSCSDSRVPPELVFDQGLGDLFTIRVAGNVLGSAQVASIEYAVEHLGAKLVVVMGHESCGAVKAAIDHKAAGKKAKSGSQDLEWLVTSIEPNIGTGRQLASISTYLDSKLRAPVMANVDAVSEQLLLRSRIISSAVAKGELKLVRGIYSMESGKVDFWGLK